VTREPTGQKGDKGQDIRRRIDALTGKIKASESMALASIQPLVDKLSRQARMRDEHRQMIETHMKTLARFETEEKTRPSKEEEAAVKAYRQALVKRARELTVKPPAVSKVDPMIKSGSVITVDSPPYSARWTQGSGASASFLNGTWSTGSLGTKGSYAGTCTFFSPLPGRFPVRFSPFMPINYSYLLGTFSYPFFPLYYSVATATGFIGAFVAASRDGGNSWEGVVDVRQTVFDRRVSIRDSASDFVEHDVNSLQAHFVTFEKPVLFALWGWGGVETWEWDSPGGWAFANGTIAASIPFLVIEQTI
jgi:hypothetical protein